MLANQKNPTRTLSPALAGAFSIANHVGSSGREQRSFWLDGAILDEERRHRRTRVDEDVLALEGRPVEAESGELRAQAFAVILGKDGQLIEL